MSHQVHLLELINYAWANKKYGQYKSKTSDLIVDIKKDIVMLSNDLNKNDVFEINIQDKSLSPDLNTGIRMI